MAKITDPDLLNQGTEVVYDTSAMTIQLLVAGNLTTDGVTLKCLYSFTREEWKTDANLEKYPFPLIPIDGPSGTQFKVVDGWTWKDTTTTDLIKDGGWQLLDTSKNILEEWMNITSLGNFQASTDTAHYIQVNDITTSNTAITLSPGEVNQAIQIFGDSTHGNFDYRDYFKIFLRVQGKKYSSYELLSEQALSSLTFKKYSLPLTNSLDNLKITHTDSEIEQAPYTNITMTYESPSVTRTVGENDYNFNYIWEGDNRSLEEIYEKQMYLLRQSTDIDNGTADIQGKIFGDVLNGAMMKFEGDTLHVYGYIDNYRAADSARVVFYDDTLTPRYPTVQNSFTFTINPSITGYEWRIYQVNNIGSLIGAIELAGEENATQDNQTYTYNYTSDIPIAVQILCEPSLDYIENVSYYTLGNVNQNVIINLQKDDNN